MFIRLSKRKAQTTLEYAILIGVVVAGLIAMQTYIKRGVQGKLKDSADSMGEQFSPGYTLSDSSTTSFTHSTDTFREGTARSDILNQTTNKVSSENVLDFNQEFWFK